MSIILTLITMGNFLCSIAFFFSARIISDLLQIEIGVSQGMLNLLGCVFLLKGISCWYLFYWKKWAAKSYAIGLILQIFLMYRVEGNLTSTITFEMFAAAVIFYQCWRGWEFFD